MTKVAGWSVVVIGVSVSACFSSTVEAQAPKRKPVACNTLKDEGACKTRDDCTWVSVALDTKTQKEKRKAYCRVMPKVRTKK